jgi:hypothetical protein
MKSRFLPIPFLMLLISFNAYAQYPEDALRLAESGYGMSARSIAMGNAMTGLSQGFDATYFNPAGLAQSRESEVTMGLNFLGYNNDATYLGANSSASSSQTDLTSLGLVYPFPTTRGSFVISFGYNRGTDFNSALSFKGFNQNSSIIPSLYNSDTTLDIPYMLYLEDVSGNPLITKNVQQSGSEYRSGGINAWSASMGLDIAQDFSIGVTLNLLSGSYTYSRTFTESDTRGIYNYSPLYFSSFTLNNDDHQDISGWNAKVGVMYKVRDLDGNTVARVGAAVTFPSFYTIADNFNDKGTAYFTTPPSPLSYSLYPGNSSYDVTTPIKFSIGASGGTSRLTLAADLEYTDYSQLEFSNSNLPSDFISSLNSQIKSELRGALTLRGGLEFALSDPRYALLVPYLRAGVGEIQSPYAGDGSDQAQKFLSGGLGVRIQNSISFDVAYQYGWWNTTSLEYSYATGNNQVVSQSTSNEKITNTNLVVTFKYDF